MKKLLVIILTLFSLHSFAQDTTYVKVRGIPGAYNFSKNAGGDSIIFYQAGVRNALNVGSTATLGQAPDSSYALLNKSGIPDTLKINLSGYTLPTVPTNVSAFANDVPYLTSSNIAGLVPKTTTINGQALSSNITLSIPAQVNPIAGTNVTITGTYPNLTFNSTGGTTLNGTGFVKANGVTITYDNSTYEPAFSKNSAFNKNFGITSGTVMDAQRIIDSLLAMNARLQGKLDSSYRDTLNLKYPIQWDSASKQIILVQSYQDSIFALIHSKDSLPDFPNDSVAVVDGGLHLHSWYRTGNIVKMVITVPSGYSFNYKSYLKKQDEI